MALYKTATDQNVDTTGSNPIHLILGFAVQVAKSGQNQEFLYKVFQDFESPSSLNLCHCKQLRFPDCGLFNSTVLRNQVKGYLQIRKSLLFRVAK